MHVFEAAIYFVYCIILLLDTMTKPTDNLWSQSTRQSLSKTPNNNHKHIFYGSLANDKYKISSFWVSWDIIKSQTIYFCINNGDQSHHKCQQTADFDF